MIHQVLKLEVESFENWKVVFEELDSERVKLGQKSYQLFQDANDPNSITLIQEWESLEGSQQFYKSEAFIKAASRAGNKGLPQVSILKKV